MPDMELQKGAEVHTENEPLLYAIFYPAHWAVTYVITDRSIEISK